MPTLFPKKVFPQRGQSQKIKKSKPAPANKKNTKKKVLIGSNQEYFSDKIAINIWENRYKQIK